MVTVRAPGQYINEAGILENAGQYILPFGQNALIITGQQALTAAGNALLNGLWKSHIRYSIIVLKGWPTQERVIQCTEKAYEKKADVVIGLGGGRVLDLAKAVGNYRNIPVVAVPTIAATCAAWAARSILYHDDGSFDRIQWNAENTKLILTDSGVILDAPKRYLASGILDSAAKYLEFGPLIAKDPDDLVLRHSVATSRLILDVLKENRNAFSQEPIPLRNGKKLIDAILYLTGAVGSFSAGRAYRGFAHPYYFASTFIPESHNQLHGEKVAFGLLAQMFLLGRSPAEIHEFARLLVYYRITAVPADWGVKDEEAALKTISEKILELFPVLRENGMLRDARDAEEALKEAEQYLKKIRSSVQGN